MHLGIDLGTSGARAAIVNDLGQLMAEGSARLETAAMRDPFEWWRAVQAAIVEALAHVSAGDICSVAVSATSGTVLAIDEGDRPTGQVFMYSDPCADAGILQDIRQYAPDWNPARAGTGARWRAGACAVWCAARCPSSRLDQFQSLRKVVRRQQFCTQERL